MRRRPSIKTGALLGGLTSLPLIALLFLGEQFAGLPFVPFDLFDWLARVLPGDVITIGIDAIVRTINALSLGPTSTAAKLLEQLMGLAGMVGLGALLGAAIAWLLRRDSGESWRLGSLAALALFLVVFAVVASVGISGDALLSALWLAVLFGGWGALLGSWLGEGALAVTPSSNQEQLSRRAALSRLAGGSAAVALGAWGLGRYFGAPVANSGASRPLANLVTATPLAGEAVESMPTPLPAATAAATTRDRIAPAPGTRPELTDNEDFYRIDINTRPIVADGQTWRLEIDGLFDNPRSLSLDDLMAYPVVTQTVTMGCISNRVAGDLIGTSNWTGARLRDVLRDLGLSDRARSLYIEGLDGFYETVVLEDMMDPRAMLVYGMNGETLPVEHGFPLRIYIPNRYGMKQPKWISRISAVNDEKPGYWVHRGWSQEARPQIVSVIDTIASDSVVDGKIPLGGIAWAGDRGIQKVEVKVDDGEWVEAVLRVPTLSPLTWVQWRYDWPSSPGRHTFTVRATDGTGALQIEREQDVRPDGATGYHIRVASV